MLRASASRVALVALAAVIAAACSRPSSEPLQLDRGLLTVVNDTHDKWMNVEIWINQQFRVTTSSIDAGSRFQVPLSSFVEGFGRRFDFGTMQVKDLRLSAKKADGTPVEIRKQFQKDGLSGVTLGGKR